MGFASGDIKGTLSGIGNPHVVIRLQQLAKNRHALRHVIHHQYNRLFVAGTHCRPGATVP